MGSRCIDEIFSYELLRKIKNYKNIYSELYQIGNTVGYTTVIIAATS